MNGLVLEGGSFRGIFTAGVLDALLDNDIMVPYCIGVSAGISYGVSYISKQPGRNLEVVTKYRHDKRYIGKRNLLKQRSLFGLDFVYDKVPNELNQFDWETYKSYPGQVVVVTTNALTGKPVYFDGKKMDKKFMMLRATCALPLAFPAIMINNKPYYDGGLSDPIPIHKALVDGCEKCIIVLTRPKGYKKTLSRSGRLAARVYKRKYPEVSKALLTRHIGYNKSLAYCEKLEEEGKAIILRPKKPLKSYEKDVEVLKRNFNMGYHMVEEKLDQIKALLNEKNNSH